MPAARSARRYAAYHGFMGQPRKLNGHLDGMAGSYLGPSIRATTRSPSA